MTKKLPALDTFRLVAALLVVAVHVSPLIAISAGADFVLTRIYARVAVPFFFVTTGYFLFSRTGGVYALIKKTAKLYIIAILIYLPLNIYNGYFKHTALRFLTDILFDGTFYHLWYLPAVILGAFLVYVLVKRLGLRAAFVISAILYIIGLGGDSYFGLVTRVPGINSFYNGLFSVIRYTRNGLFFAPVFILIGVLCHKMPKKITAAKAAAGLVVSLVLMTGEGIGLYAGGIMRHDSMYISLVPCMFFLFTLLNIYNGKAAVRRRSMATAVYIIHPWAIVAVWYASVLLGLDYAMEQYSIVFYVLSAALSLAVAAGAVQIRGKLKTQRVHERSRAWVEIDLGAFRHNISRLRALVPESCELMAVVKADAYGLGAVKIASELSRCGVEAFAVATITEAVELRKGGISGEILVLGYTRPENAGLLSRYKLTQLAIDAEYARVLAGTGRKLNVHAAVDTGMHRVGIEAANTDELESVFKYKNLTVTGMATHLAEADSLDKGCEDFTRLQIERLFGAVEAMRSRGYNTGKTHFQASYGIYNYSGHKCDYARPGIAMYGMMSHGAETQTKQELMPVVALRARIAEVRWIDAGESVSYGRLFTADKRVRVATVSIGYADGMRRHLKSEDYKCLVRSQQAKLIGRVCMDYFMLDVSEIEGVQTGDVVTIIGADGEYELRCEDYAEKSGTITNDILCGLGNRLPRIYINE